MSWFVYIIEGSDNSLYTGITTDLERRFQQHLKGSGAKYFYGRKPVKIVYSENHEDRSSASVREAAIKKLSRQQKEKLIQA
ncbi:MAG TPA: GIY-YIG nuclease family protein [Cycloclasticus sp.]|jgi:putative endonuclease|nr:GIY-YIG nuclease family protein [Cycloclasticus sp.]HIL91930.1 GIY-YIG nuclease family protein [Cycloclasticus sp.]